MRYIFCYFYKKIYHKNGKEGESRIKLLSPDREHCNIAGLSIGLRPSSSVNSNRFFSSDLSRANHFLYALLTKSYLIEKFTGGSGTQRDCHSSIADIEKGQCPRLEASDSALWF